MTWVGIRINYNSIVYPETIRIFIVELAYDNYVAHWRCYVGLYLQWSQISTMLMGKRFFRP